MEMRHGMPVWAPTDLEMATIAKSVARERAKAAQDAIKATKHLIVSEHKGR